MAFSKKQLEILRFPQSEHEALICDGAVRSGKTSVMSLSFILWAMDQFDRCNFAFCGKSVGSAERNIIRPLLAVRYLQEEFELQYTRSDHTLIVRRGEKENTFYLFGGKDESSYTLIQGITLAGVLLDEVALMPRSFVEQALARCSVDGALLWFSCNPGNPQHWFKQEWIDKKEDHNALYLHFEMTDNPGLSEKTLARYKSMYPSGVFYDRYIRGLWVAAEGLVYQYFADNVNDFLINDPLEWAAAHRERFSTIMIGVDFGGNSSATKFQATGITPSGTVVALEEDYIKQEIDPDSLNKQYALFVQAVTGKYGYSQTRADSAEQILIRGLKHTAQKGKLGTQVLNALKMPITDRIRLVLLLMRQGRLYVSRRCPHLIEAFQTALYEPDTLDDVRLDDGTTDIDSLDAFEYSIEPWYKQLEAAGFRR